MRNSPLVVKINISTKKEFEQFTKDMRNEDLKSACFGVIFGCVTYKEAGHNYDVSSQSIYQCLKRIHFRKYRIKYVSSNTENS